MIALDGPALRWSEASVASAWIEQCDNHHDHLVKLLGIAEYEQRQRDRRAQLRAVEAGLLRRSLLSATRPR